MMNFGCVFMLLAVPLEAGQKGPLRELLFWLIPTVLSLTNRPVAHLLLGDRRWQALPLHVPH